MNLAAVMDAVKARLDTITGLRATAFPDGKVAVPAAVVTMPNTMTFDETYGRGSDRLSLPVVLIISGSVPRTVRDSFSQYCSPVGAKSIKFVLESGTYTAFDSLRVTGVEWDTYVYSGIEYPAAIFDLDIYGSGTS